MERNDELNNDEIKEEEEIMRLLSGLKGIDDLIKQIPPRTEEGFFYQEYLQSPCISSTTITNSTKRTEVKKSRKSSIRKKPKNSILARVFSRRRERKGPMETRKLKRLHRKLVSKF